MEPGMGPLLAPIIVTSWTVVLLEPYSVRSAGVKGLLKVTVKPVAVGWKPPGATTRPRTVSGVLMPEMRLVPSLTIICRSTARAQRATVQCDGEGMHAGIGSREGVAGIQNLSERVGAEDADGAGVIGIDSSKSFLGCNRDLKRLASRLRTGNHGRDDKVERGRWTNVTYLHGYEPANALAGRVEGAIRLQTAIQWRRGNNKRADAVGQRYVVG